MYRMERMSLMRSICVRAMTSTSKASTFALTSKKRCALPPSCGTRAQSSSGVCEKRKQRLPPNSKQRDLLNHNNNSSSSNKSKNNKRSKYLCLTSGGGAAPSPRAHLQLPLFSISPADACARVQQQQQQRKPPLRQRRCARLYFLFDGPLYHPRTPSRFFKVRPLSVLRARS